MSISELANEEILRTDRRDLESRLVERHLNPAAERLGLQPAATAELHAAIAPVAAANPNPVQKTPGSAALDGLVKYIPTEAVTLYVAATAALQSVVKGMPPAKAAELNWELYWGFVVLTPILFILIYLGKRRSQSLPILPATPADWPWWKLVACTIAFMVWALAVPPLLTSDPGKVAAAFGALLVSTLLSLIGGVVEPPPNPPPAPQPFVVQP